MLKTSVREFFFGGSKQHRISPPTGEGNSVLISKPKASNLKTTSGSEKRRSTIPAGGENKPSEMKTYETSTKVHNIYRKPSPSYYPKTIASTSNSSSGSSKIGGNGGIFRDELSADWRRREFARRSKAEPRGGAAAYDPRERYWHLRSSFSGSLPDSDICSTDQQAGAGDGRGTPPGDYWRPRAMSVVETSRTPVSRRASAAILKRQEQGGGQGGKKRNSFGSLFCPLGSLRGSTTKKQQTCFNDDVDVYYYYQPSCGKESSDTGSQATQESGSRDEPCGTPRQSTTHIAAECNTLQEDLSLVNLNNDDHMITKGGKDNQKTSASPTESLSCSKDNHSRHEQDFPVLENKASGSIFVDSNRFFACGPSTRDNASSSSSPFKDLSPREGTNFPTSQAFPKLVYRFSLKNQYDDQITTLTSNDGIHDSTPIFLRVAIFLDQLMSRDRTSVQVTSGGGFLLVTTVTSELKTEGTEGEPLIAHELLYKIVLPTKIDPFLAKVLLPKSGPLMVEAPVVQS